MADAPHDEPTDGLTGDEQLAAGEALEGELLDEVHPAPAPGDSDTAGDPPGAGREADLSGEAGAGGAARTGGAGPPDDVPSGGGPSGAAPASGDPPGTPSETGEVDFETLVTDLERVATERDQFLDAYRRAQADFDNYRKQAARRHEEQVTRSVGGLVERLLPVLDACDAALSHGVTEVEPIVAALLGTLEKEGLQRIEPKGEPFDPTVAEAVVHEPGGGGEQIVAEVMRAGYSWQGHVLRPAMVKVTD